MVSVPEDRPKAILNQLCAGLGQYIIRWRAPAGNWLQLYYQRIDLGWLYGTHFNTHYHLAHRRSRTQIYLFCCVFQELLTFSLPFINYHSIKRKICDIIYPLAHRNANEWCRPSVTLQSNCTYCNERPTLPYYMGCSHIFCYYCLKVRIRDECGREESTNLLEYLTGKQNSRCQLQMPRM